MRILYFTPGCYDKGGISRYGRYQVTALRELYGSAAVRAYSVRARSEGDFEHPFDVTWCAGGLGPRRKVAFVARAAIEAVRWRPDVVVAAHVNLSGLAVGLARATGAASALNVYGREVWSGLRPDAAWGLRASDLVLSDCEFTARYVLDAGLRPAAAPPLVLWDCVDTARFSPGPASGEVRARYGLPDASHVTVLALGRIGAGAAHKGYDRLLDAFARAAPAVPALRLVYAGSGDLVPELRARAAASGVGERVVFAGSIHEDDLPDVYRACDVFSLVSDRGKGRGEGIPLTPLEAAACGKPILVGDQDGSREAVVDGENGFLLDPFDLDAHAERLVRLASDAALRARMGDAARRRVLAHHDYPVFRARLAGHLASIGLAPNAAGALSA